MKNNIIQFYKAIVFVLKANTYVHEHTRNTNNKKNKVKELRVFNFM